MATRMLIDARHREETRVAVVQNNRIEEFDFESAEHKQLKGNIYLAKVTRVEPSLQAAFIDYGGNRHGFLAFSEIHPDYYQIPESDRQALLAEEAEHAREEAELRDDADDAAAIAAAEDDEEDADHREEIDEALDEDSPEEGDLGPAEEADEPDAGEDGGDEPSMQDIRHKRMNLRRRYKIQDVIHRRQLLLVQVVKEERGNKGAALTTYLSLAGRYCVLMPNTSHGGGISRKISNAGDRKRLKSVVSEFKLPPTMGCIVRTAGMTRTKAEIKRDFTYLARLWDDIRAATLKATAPAKIHADSDLVKRAIRDIYNREIEEVIVEGDEGYKAARNFMKLLMPSHVRRVKPYADPTPLFQRYHVEDQLGAMYQPLVQLKSGGYLVINPTEALVSIDINSGRSTREHNIEQTALKTNIEAAREIARQLRLRDMAGLVVIDFIDMDHHSNNRKVENALKDALKNDRARIQVGRISSFGLLEMSRQRLRTGVLEASTTACPHCEGTGLMRTASSAGLSALRMLEEEAAKGRGSQLTLRCGSDAAIYLLNSKRSDLVEIEERYGVSIAVLPDSRLEGAAMSVDAGGPPPTKRFELAPLPAEDDGEIERFDEEDEEDEEDAEAIDAEVTSDVDQGSRRRRSRRGGRGRSRRDEPRDDTPPEATENSADQDIVEASAPGDGSPDRGEDDEPGRRRSRRGRRGGRRRREGGEGASEAMPAGAADAERSEQDALEDRDADQDTAEAMIATPEPEPQTAAPRRRVSRKTPATEVIDVKPAPEAEAPAKPARVRRQRKTEATVKSDAQADLAEDTGGGDVPAPAAPKRASRSRKSDVDAVAEASETSAASADLLEDGATPRQGWWQRTFGA